MPSRKPLRQLGLFDKPERTRDYAKDRAYRDAKYRALGFKSYNDYEHQRRTKKAIEVEGFPSYGAKVKHRQKVKRFTENFLDKVREVGFDFEQWIEDEDFEETIYWELFRDSYGKGTPA